MAKDKWLDEAMTEMRSFMEKAAERMDSETNVLNTYGTMPVPQADQYKMWLSETPDDRMALLDVVGPKRFLDRHKAMMRLQRQFNPLADYLAAYLGPVNNPLGSMEELDNG